MKRALGGMLVVVATLLACRAPEDPERRRALERLQDVRPEVRVAAMRALADKANREEATAIAKAAQNAPAEVRREAAAALGRAKAPEAVDLLGAMLRDNSDSTRAVAVESLAGRPDPKVKGYLANAYVDGGPRTREAVAATKYFADAVAAEAEVRRSRATRAVSEGAGAVRIDGLFELSVEGSGESLAQLAALAAAEDKATAVTAAAALARDPDPSSIPLLEKLAADPRDAVRRAGLVGLLRLGMEGADLRLADEVVSGAADDADLVLEVLWERELSTAAKDRLCVAAGTRTEANLAVDAFRLAGAQCDPASFPPPEPDHEQARWRVLGWAGVRDDALLESARKATRDLDTERALNALGYLSSVGGRPEAEAASRLASEERQRLVDYRLRLRRKEIREQAEMSARDRAWRKRLADLLFEGDEEKTRPLPREVGNRLTRMLLDSSTHDVMPEHRPGVREVIAGAAVVAARLGATDAAALGERLLDDEDPRLRQAAVSVAYALGDAGEALRAKLRVDPDPDVVRAAFARDVLAGREESTAALATLLAESDDAAERAELLPLLAPHVEAHRELFIEAARGSDAAVVPAVEAIGSLPGEDVTEVLAERVNDVRAIAVLEAVVALAEREEDVSRAALVRAAVSRDGRVRAAALEALAARAACGEALGRARVLSGDFEAPVRRAAARVIATCSRAGTQDG